MSRTYRRRREVRCRTGKRCFDEREVWIAAAALERRPDAGGRPAKYYECQFCGYWHTTTHQWPGLRPAGTEIESMDEQQARRQGCTCAWANVVTGIGRDRRTWQQIEGYDEGCPVAEHGKHVEASAIAARSADQVADRPSSGEVSEAPEVRA